MGGERCAVRVVRPSCQTWKEAVCTGAPQQLAACHCLAALSELWADCSTNLWADVPEGQCLVILIDYGGRDLLGHNLVKQGGAVTVCLPASME